MEIDIIVFRIRDTIGMYILLIIFGINVLDLFYPMEGFFFVILCFNFIQIINLCESLK